MHLKILPEQVCLSTYLSPTPLPSPPASPPHPSSASAGGCTASAERRWQPMSQCQRLETELRMTARKNEDQMEEMDLR